MIHHILNKLLSIMFDLPIKVQLYLTLQNAARFVPWGFAIFVASFYSSIQLTIINESRESLILSRMPNTTRNSIISSCNTPYDDSRCSVQSLKNNNNNNSEYCLSDVRAMSAHILPPILYVMQVSFVREFFVLNGKYANVFVNILWLVSLFIFIPISIAVHGSTCYHFYVTYIVGITGGSLGLFVLCVFVQTMRDLDASNVHTKHTNNNTLGINIESEDLSEMTVVS